MTEQLPVEEEYCPLAELSDDIIGSKILLVDDTQVTRKLTRKILEVHGFSRIVEAEDGVIGLELASQENPDLIVLDLIMPNMDGFELCRRLRQMERFRETPVLVQTASTKTEDRAEAFRNGASDLVAYPVNSFELISRAKLHLSRQAMTRSLKQFNSRVEDELAEAAKMQTSLLPTKEHINSIENKYGLNIRQYYFPSSELGGDMWGILPIDGERVLIYILDFSGHGVAAAINAFRAHTLLLTEEKIDCPKRTLKSLNKHFSETLKCEQFATALAAVIDCKKNTLTYVSAGYNKPILIEDGGATLLDSSGLPLGIDMNADYTLHQLHFGNKSKLLLYSDAIIETTGHNGKFIDEDELLEVAAKSNVELCYDVLQHFNNHCSGEADDDVTVVTIERL